MKISGLKILATLFFLFPTGVFASNETLSQTGQTQEVEFNLLSEVQSEIKNSVSINTQYTVNLRLLEEKLKILYPTFLFEAEWDITGASSQKGFEFKRTFQEKGLKEISLTLYKISEEVDGNGRPVENKETILIKNFELLVYDKSIALVLSNNISKSELDNYIQFSKNDGTYIYQIGPLSKTDLELNSLLNALQNYKNISGIKSDYIAIWGDRDFIFDVLAKINREVQVSKEKITSKLNIIGISPYNINILQSYLGNFISGKSWIDDLVLISEEGKYLILKQNQISTFKEEMTKNQHSFVDVGLENTGINNALFISNFVNNLSNLGYTTDSIYIFLIIPAILAGISFFKHFIGFSPIGVVIPLFVTLLFFKLGFLVTLGLIGIYIAINLAISVFVDRYNLLYTPKISFLLTINIVLFIIILNTLYSFNILSLDLNDVLYFIIFVIISEKFINIIVSKDLTEYKSPFFYTLVIAAIIYGILNISAIKLLTLAYPEIIIFLIPVNFLMGRFTGLRVTEYFRFKEIIKSVEEE